MTTMDYIEVDWIHENLEDPIRLVSELNFERFEQRKLEFFRDGHVGYAQADRLNENPVLSRTALGTEPVPTIDAINADPQFHARQISASEFKTLWLRHARGKA